jgi:hypothetical protein
MRFAVCSLIVAACLVSTIATFASSPVVPPTPPAPADASSGQFVLPSGPMTTFPSWDIEIFREYEPLMQYRSKDRSMEGLGSFLRKLIESKVQAGDTVRLKGYFILGEKYPLQLPNITLCGFGSYATTVHTACRIDKTDYKPLGTPGILLATNNRFEDIELIGECHDPNEDGGLVGWNTPGKAFVEFLRCRLNGKNRNDWLIYSWIQGPKTLIFTQCDLFFARQGIAMCGSSDITHDVTVNDCRFYGDANGSKSMGASSLNDIDKGGVLAGIVLRGGSLTVNGAEFWLVGLTAPYDPTGKWGCPRMAAITDHYYTPGRIDSKFVLKNIRFHATPNTTTVVEVFDIRAVKPTMN